MKAITLAIIGLVTFGTISCHARKVKGNGNIITKEIQVSDYNELKVGSGIDASGNSFFGNRESPRVNYAQQAGKAELTVTIDENLLPLLKFKSEGKALVIETEKGTTINPSKLSITTHSGELTRLRVSGGIDFFLTSHLSGDNIEINASGASDVYLERPVRITNLCKINLSGASDLKIKDLECDRIESRSSGSSDIKMAGKANEGEYRCSGSSDIKSYDFVVKKLKCSASGSSDILTHVTDYLDASASGSSDIKYKGNPEVKKSSSGSSDIDHVN
ncbi:head GIN domain-containing protein [Parabacteroides sp.]